MHKCGRGRPHQHKSGSLPPSRGIQPEPHQWMGRLQGRAWTSEDRKGPHREFSLDPGGRSMPGLIVILYGEGGKEGPSGDSGKG